jgi:hypothetical protein
MSTTPESVQTVTASVVKLSTHLERTIMGAHSQEQLYIEVKTRIEGVGRFGLFNPLVEYFVHLTPENYLEKTGLSETIFPTLDDLHRFVSLERCASQDLKLISAQMTKRYKKPGYGNASVTWRWNGVLFQPVAEGNQREMVLSLATPEGHEMMYLHTNNERGSAILYYSGNPSSATVLDTMSVLEFTYRLRDMRAVRGTKPATVD